MTSLRKLLLVVLSLTLLVSAQKQRTPRIPGPSAPQAVLSWQWDYFITGDRLFYRAGTAPGREPFQMIQLPGAAQKIAADDGRVYVWLKDSSIAAYAVGDNGPAGAVIHLSGDDPDALAALAVPPAARKSALSTRPPENVTLTPQRLLVANSGSDSVSAIDTSTNTVVGTLTLTANSAPADVAAASNNFEAFTANNANQTACPSCTNLGASVFDPRTMISSGILSGTFPSTVSVTPDASIVYVGDDTETLTTASVFVRAYNAGNGVSLGTIALPASPSQMRISADGSNAFMVSSDDLYYSCCGLYGDYLTMFSTATQTPVNLSFPGGASCYAMAIQPGTGNVYVGCNNGLLNTTPVVYVVSTSNGALTQLNSFLTTTTYGMAFSPDGTKLYVTHYGANTVEILDPSGNTLGLIATQTNPVSITVNAGGTRAYVTNIGSNSVSVLDLTANTLITNVTVGTHPLAASLTFAPPTLSSTPAQLAFAGNFGQTSISSQGLVLGADQPAGLTWTAAAATQSGGNWLSLSATSGTFPQTIQATANGNGLAIGVYKGTITVTSSGAGNSPFAIPVTLTMAGPVAGSIGGTVNAASFAANTPVSAGSLISIFGTGLGPTSPVASISVPLPTTLSGVTVTIGGKSAPLLFVSAGQINCQVPFELAGQTSVPIVVTNGTATTPAGTVSLSASSPGIFIAKGQGAVLNQDFTTNSATNPAKRGSVIQIFATGQGAVSPPVASGAAAPGSPVAISTATPIVLIGGTQAVVQFSGLAPGFVGLWQINATVPSNITPGSAVTLQVLVTPAASNATTVAVQ